MKHSFSKIAFLDTKFRTTYFICIYDKTIVTFLAKLANKYFIEYIKKPKGLYFVILLPILSKLKYYLIMKFYLFFFLFKLIFSDFMALYYFMIIFTILMY